MMTATWWLLESGGLRGLLLLAESVASEGGRGGRVSHRGTCACAWLLGRATEL